MSPDVEERDPDQLEAAGEDSPSVVPASTPAPPPTSTPPTDGPDGPGVQLDIPAMTGGSDPALQSRVQEQAPPSVDAQALPVRQHAQLLAREDEGRVAAIESAKEQAVNYDRQLQALKDTKEESLQWAHVGALNEHVQQQQQQAMDMQRDLQQQALLYRKAVDDFKALNPNPWADRGTGYTIGSAIAVALGGFGAGLLGSSNNPALQIINEAAHRDLQAQQLAFEKAGKGAEMQGTIYAQMRQIYQDKNAAMAASWATTKELVAARAQAQLMALAPVQRTLQAQKTIAQLQAEALEAGRKAADINFTQRVQAQKLVDSETAQNQLAAYRAMLEKHKAASANMFEEEGLKGKLLDQADTLYSSFTGSFADNTKIAKMYFALPPDQQLDPQNFLAAKTAFANLSQEVKRLRNQGVRFNPKLQEIDELLSKGSEGGVLSTDLKNQLTGGALAKAFEVANDLMARDYEKQIQTTTGKSPTYWMAREHQKISEENMKRRYEAGIGGPDGTTQPADQPAE